MDKCVFPSMSPGPSSCRGRWVGMPAPGGLGKTGASVGHSAKEPTIQSTHFPQGNGSLSSGKPGGISEDPQVAPGGWHPQTGKIHYRIEKEFSNWKHLKYIYMSQSGVSLEDPGLNPCSVMEAGGVFSVLRGGKQ